MVEQAPIPPGWYYAQGDPPGTNRYWDGGNWIGEPRFLDPNQTMATAFGASSSPPSPWARIGGRLIDGLIWGVINAITSIGILADAFRSGLAGDPQTAPISTSTAVFTAIGSTVAVVAYETILNSKGGTLGKRATQLRVVKADGSALDLATAFRRMLLYIAVQALSLAVTLAYLDQPGSAVPLLAATVFWIVALVGLVLLFTDEGRTPWDRVGGTKVVRS